MTEQSPILVIVGASAAGKSDFALALAKQLNGEIISADSRQIYRELNLGTGKPSPEMLAEVPHHLIGSCSINHPVTAADFARMAGHCYHKIRTQGHYCLVAGGTGLWIQAFIDGMDNLPGQDQGFRQKMQARAQRYGKDYLHQQLRQIDPNSAHRIPANNSVRIIRALEIYHLTGVPASCLRGQQSQPTLYPALWLGVDRPREELYRRCERRVEQWLELGWINEVQQLMETTAYPSDYPPLKAIGFPIIQQYLSGQLTLEQCERLIKRDTRRYIKRQLTWFRKNQRIVWFYPHELDCALRHIKRCVSLSSG